MGLNSDVNHDIRCDSTSVDNAWSDVDSDKLCSDAYDNCEPVISEIIKEMCQKSSINGMYIYNVHILFNVHKH